MTTRLFASKTEGLTPILGHLHMASVDGASLKTPFIVEDVKLSLFSMHGTKFPSPDGYFLSKFNFTLIFLIPKVTVPLNMTQFKPIALSNVAAKVVGKVLATRLKSILPSVISESQSAFVPQRLIIDNVLLSFEAYHFIKNQRQRKRGFMFIKLDMLKAYDRIKCEGLIALIRDACLKGTIKGIKMGATLEPLSHPTYFFADDTLLLEPMSPLAKVYKAIYFSDGDYWTSTLGPKPSFTWRSLLSVRDIMKRAIRWKIGDGRTIRIWENNWLEHTCEEILKIPLNNLNQADSIIWGPHPKGIFTVKTAYEFIHTLSQEASLGPNTSNPQYTFYKWFWKIKIPRKIKHFLWRALNNNLPTTNKLRQWKVDIQPTCILDGTHEETIMHVLHLCSFTQEVNRILKITYINGR
ncbi:hypothetical protein LIER_08228 [Lithospermum erythrorhizon]|uniref:Reverse transcriptase n=1 Tax=Lithospermum erythrorhizon TaxID=34254 RepID=A0AAV3PFV2_LITER